MIDEQFPICVSRDTRLLTQLTGTICERAEDDALLIETRKDEYGERKEPEMLALLLFRPSLSSVSFHPFSFSSLPFFFLSLSLSSYFQRPTESRVNAGKPFAQRKSSLVIFDYIFDSSSSFCRFHFPGETSTGPRILPVARESCNLVVCSMSLIILRFGIGQRDIFHFFVQFEQTCCAK